MWATVSCPERVGKPGRRRSTPEIPYEIVRISYTAAGRPGRAEEGTVNSLGAVPVGVPRAFRRNCSWQATLFVGDQTHSGGWERLDTRRSDRRFRPVNVPTALVAVRPSPNV